MKAMVTATDVAEDLMAANVIAVVAPVESNVRIGMPDSGYMRDAPCYQCRHPITQSWDAGLKRWHQRPCPNCQWTGNLMGSSPTAAPEKPATITDQPAPVAGLGVPVWELVIADMQERDRVGRERYGTPLQAFNGRDALVDAYQEELDKVVYMRQAIIESEALRVENERLRKRVTELVAEHERLRGMATIIRLGKGTAVVKKVVDQLLEALA